MSATSAIYSNDRKYRMCCINGHLWRVEYDTGVRSTREVDSWIAAGPLVERTLAEAQLASKSGSSATYKDE